MEDNEITVDIADTVGATVHIGRYMVSFTVELEEDIEQGCIAAGSLSLNGMNDMAIFLMKCLENAKSIKELMKWE